QGAWPHAHRILAVLVGSCVQSIVFAESLVVVGGGLVKLGFPELPGGVISLKRPRCWREGTRLQRFLAAGDRLGVIGPEHRGYGKEKQTCRPQDPSLHVRYSESPRIHPIIVFGRHSRTMNYKPWMQARACVRAVHRLI